MPTTIPMISIVIPVFNMRHIILETIQSCKEQDYPNVEILVYDDCSTDGLNEIDWKSLGVKFYRGETNLGVGNAFNEAIRLSTGEIVVFLCGDDLFTNPKVLSDIAFVFETCPTIGHVSRFYYQFVDGYKGAVRAWRTRDPIIQANNPSGLSFRKKALEGCRCENKMFVETSSITSQVLKRWKYHILRYDTIAVRVHASTSTQKDYWLKRRVSSPVLDWVVGLGVKGIATDFCSLVQIKNGFTNQALLEEICNFIIVRPLNLLHPMFWFYAIITLITPRRIMRKIPVWYRRFLGSKTTKIIERPI